MNSSNRSPIAPILGGRPIGGSRDGALSVAGWSRTSQASARRARTARAAPAPRAGSRRSVAASAGSQRNAGPDRERAAPRPRVVLGRDERREADRQAAVLLADQPRQRSREATAQAQQRRLGRRAGGGRHVAEAHDALAIGDPQDGQPPVVGSVDGLRHAGLSRRSPIRTSCSRRYDGPGWGRRSGTRPRIPATGASGGGVRPVPRAAPSAGGRGGRGRRGGRRCRGAAARRLGDGGRGHGRRPPPGGRARPSAGASAPVRPRRAATAGSPLDEHVGLEGDGLGLEVGALGLELEAEHLAPDGSSGGGASDSGFAGPPARPAPRPVMNDRIRLRGRATSARARRIASGSSVVTPADLARRPVADGSVAPQDGTALDGRRRAGAPSTTGSG